jgi:hypothetical protein
MYHIICKSSVDLDMDLLTLLRFVTLFTMCPGALLGHALKSNKALTELNLSSTQLGGMGAESLAKGLAKNSALRSLVLQRTGIDDRGAVALAAALGSNRCAGVGGDHRHMQGCVLLP